MIKEAELINVQSHTKTLFRFSPGITVLSGASDVGKSSCIRGLQFAAGVKTFDSLQRFGTKKMSIRVDNVTRVKTSAKNEYKVDGSIFKALRKQVPQEVFNQLKLKEENFQGQHDPYFLINETAGKVAATLNQVADLEIITKSLKAVKSAVATAKAEKKFQDEEVKAQQEKVEKLKWAIEAEKELTKIEEIEALADSLNPQGLKDRLTTIETLRSSVDKIPDTFQDKGKLLQLQKELEINPIGIKLLIDGVKNNQVNIPCPKADINKLTTLEVLTPVNTSKISECLEAVKTAQLQLNSFPEEITNVSGVVSQLENIQNSLNLVEDLKSKAISASNLATELAKRVAEARTEFNDKLAALKICPLCGGNTHENCKSK